MAIFFKGELIPRDKISQYVEKLETFSPVKNAVPSEYNVDNSVAKIDRITAQIHLFRTVKREGGFDRLRPYSRKAKSGNDFYIYKSSAIVDAYDLKILLALCALGKPTFANYLHKGDKDGWKGISCDIKVVDILKFIGRRNDPENRERVFESLGRMRWINVNANIYNPKPSGPKSFQGDFHETVSGALIKIYERAGDALIKIGLFYTLAKEAWINTDNPKYAPISESEVRALSKSDIAIILFVFLRSDLASGAGAKYRYDDMVRLVRGEDWDVARAYPQQPVRNSRNGHHAGADRESIRNIKMALKLIDKCTNMKIYKHRDLSKFVAVRAY